jgi:hypothetical protein
MYKVLQTFEVPGYAKFEAGREYDIIPEAEEMTRRGLIAPVERMIDKTPADVVNTAEDSGQKTTKNSKRVAK